LAPTRYSIHFVAERPKQRKLHHRPAEVAHRRHVAHEDDGVVDLPDLAERVHFVNSFPLFA
jgi:hypothetical protein